MRVNWRKIDIDDNGTMRWRRLICGTNVEIPFPPKEKEPWEDQESQYITSFYSFLNIKLSPQKYFLLLFFSFKESVHDTDAEAASRLTWKVTKDPPLPRGVINELRNKYKPWRYSSRLKNRPFI